MSASQSNQNLNQASLADGSIMVGILYNDGVVMAITMTGHLIYYLEDRIYCCARSTGYDRESLLEVANELEDMASNTFGYRGALVVQALELLTKKYETLQDAELLLAGEDVSGLHLFTLTCQGYARVCYAALGSGAEVANDYLSNHWKNELSVKEAEALARRAIANSRGDMSKVDVCVLFKSR